MTSPVDAIAYLPTVAKVSPSDALAASSTLGDANVGGDFAAWFSAQLSTVNDKVAFAENQLQGLATGEVQNLHQVMINLEEARLSFQLLAQVRNKMLEAYQDVIRMQV